MDESSSADLDLVIRQTAPIPLVARLNCASGEVVAVVGPSGSGKTTLLRCIAGLASPQQGRIVAGGEIWLDTDSGVNLGPRRRRVGFVFQSYGLFPHLSALDNIVEGMSQSPLSAKGRKSRARELLALVRLAGLEGRRPRELSGGQQQRVAVARALAREPRVLLLDEPFAAVDRVTREKLYVELAELRRHLAMPIILVTHDLEEATLLADRLCVMAHGRTVQTGAPLDVLEHPESAEVAHLLGISNIFSGRVVEHRESEGTTVLDWDGWRLFISLQPQHQPGSSIAWVIPSRGVLLSSLNGASRGMRDNQFNATIKTLLILGDRVQATVWDDTGTRRLFLIAPRHVAERYGLREGGSVSLRLRGEHIHLMSAES